ncbi:MAG: hypothetical protein RR675_05195, partial [Oscillospiraceae bacterium]
SDYQPQNGTGRNKQAQRKKPSTFLSGGRLCAVRQAWRQGGTWRRALRSCRFAQAPPMQGSHSATAAWCMAALISFASPLCAILSAI